MKNSKKKLEQAILNKLSVIVIQDTGVGYYRQVNPASFIGLNKLANSVITTKLTGKSIQFRIGEPKYGKASKGTFILDDKILGPVCKGADIIWTTVLANIDEIMKVLDLREWTGAKWVVDIDDNIYATSRDNPAQRDVRRIYKNMETCFRLADGLTVSVPMLKKLYSPLNKNIYIQKNCLNFNYWKEQPKRHHKGIRIGWEGAYGHKADVEMVYPIIQRLKQDYPDKNIEFVVFGPDFGWGYEYHEWVKLDEYPKALADLDLDIAIAPLTDSSYNRCKSNIRILENSILKYPVVASPTENQKDLPCLYSKNNFEWYQNLEKLILDKGLREEFGQKQYDFVLKNYDISKNVDDLVNWFYDLPRRTDVAPDRVPDM